MFGKKLNKSFRSNIQGVYFYWFLKVITVCWDSNINGNIDILYIKGNQFREDIDGKKKVFFRALPESPNPPPDPETVKSSIHWHF